MVTMAARSAPVGASCAFCSGVADCASAAVAKQQHEKTRQKCTHERPPVFEKLYGCGPS